MYPSIGWGGAWQYGGTSWTIDYPRGDRHIAALVRRLSIIDARSVEQPVNLDDGDDVFNWPWLYAVEVGQWDLTDSQAAQLREYLLRGGFLMVDDFHGSREWTIFVESMRRVFPDRPIVDLPDDDPIFHTFWDLEERQQIPGLPVRLQRPAVRAGRFRRALARHLRRPRARHGGHLPQHGSWATPSSTPTRPQYPQELLGHRDAHVPELHRLRDDALAARRHVDRIPSTHAGRSRSPRSVSRGAETSDQARHQHRRRHRRRHRRARVLRPRARRARGLAVRPRARARARRSRRRAQRHRRAPLRARALARRRRSAARRRRRRRGARQLRLRGRRARDAARRPAVPCSRAAR